MRKPEKLRIVLISSSRPAVATEGSNESEGLDIEVQLGRDHLAVPAFPQSQDSLRLPFPKRLGIQDLANGDTEMSPHEHRVSSFVGDLVEMARSHEELPKAREDLEEARATIDDQAATIQRLELKLLERANELQDKLSQIRAAEVARDDAELRFLEAEDRTEKAVAFVRTVFGNAGQLIQALEPPKPEPVASAASEHQVEATGDLPLPNSETGVNVESSPQSQDEAPSTGSTYLKGVSGEIIRPTSDAATSTIDGQSTDAMPKTAPEPGDVATGQSEPNPSATTTNIETAEPQTVTSNGAEPIASAQSGDGPYSGLKYYDQPFACDLDKWIAGGGTEASYRWRPWHTDAA